MKAKHVKYVFTALVMSVMLSVTFCSFLTEEQRREYQRREHQRQVYYSNYYYVLSWVKEGMDESTFRDKIGDSYVEGCLSSTYSSMGYTVHEYAMGQVDDPNREYGVIRVYLTFINGKLDSISTFR